MSKVELKEHEIEFTEFFDLLDSNCRLHDLHVVATKDRLSFYYLDDNKTIDIGFIRSDFKCFLKVIESV